MVVGIKAKENSTTLEKMIYIYIYIYVCVCEDVCIYPAACGEPATVPGDDNDGGDGDGDGDDNDLPRLA